MGFEMESQWGWFRRVEGGISRGISPAWKNAWSEISSIVGRVVGSDERREDMRCFASSEMGVPSGKSY
jgi:hypothetical protein